MVKIGPCCSKHEQCFWSHALATSAGAPSEANTTPAFGPMLLPQPLDRPPKRLLWPLEPCPCRQRRCAHRGQYHLSLWSHALATNAGAPSEATVLDNPVLEQLHGEIAKKQNPSKNRASKFKIGSIAWTDHRNVSNDKRTNFRLDNVHGKPQKTSK